MEIEIEKKMSSLYVLVHKEENGAVRIVCRKPTYTGQYTDKTKAMCLNERDKKEESENT